MKLLKRLSKEIAHLTYSRNNPTRIKKDWEILEHKNMIFEALKVFLANVDKSLLSDEWKKPF